MSECDPLEETLACFRETLPPPVTRDANRAAVRAGLERRDVKPWWRRSVALPLPVVLATAAALLISLTVHLLPAGSSTGRPQPDIAVKSSREGGESEARVLAAAPLHVDYFETQRYLSGFGVIDRDVLYTFQE